MITLITLAMLAACPPDAVCQPGMVCVKYVRTDDNRAVTTCMTPEELVVWKQVQRARKAARKAAEAARKKAAETKPVVVAPPAPTPESVVPLVETTLVVENKPTLPPPPPVCTPEQCPTKKPKHGFWEDRWLVVGGRLSLGAGYGINNAHLSGLASVRVKSVPLHLGVEGFYAFDHIGWGIQGLVYTFDNGVLAHHIDLGILWTEGKGNLLSAFDVPRARDFVFGTGLEWRFHPNLSLTVDWRASMPDLHYMATHNHPIYDSSGHQIYGNAGRYLDTRAVVGNVFSQSQLLVGLMVHTP